MPDLVYPPQPPYEEPAAPKGLSGAFGGKKRHAEAIATARPSIKSWLRGLARAQHEEARRPPRGCSDAAEQNESDRLAKLAEAEATYKTECAQREAEAATQNDELTKFINDLAFDVEYAIEDYVGIVLSNSVYPDAFPVEHEHKFDLAPAS